MTMEMSVKQDLWHKQRRVIARNYVDVTVY